MPSFLYKQAQVQLHDVAEDGTVLDIMPINTSQDVYVRDIETGRLVLPGDARDKTLTTTLNNIRKYLYNLQYVAAEVRVVSDNKKDESLINIPSTIVTTELSKEIDALSDKIDSVEKDLKSADETHANTNASTSVYGHVKLTDDYNTKASNGTADDALAPSQNALYNAWKDLDDSKAAKVHTSTDKDTYGGATSSQYGHVRTEDDYTQDSSDSAVVPSQHAIKLMWDKITELTASSDDPSTPVSHASADKTYGVGSPTLYGHLKVSDEYNSDTQQESGKASDGVAASSWAVKRCYDAIISIMTGKITGHADERGTSEKYSHVALSDNYKTSAGGANLSVGASSKAVNDAYTELTTDIATHSKEKASDSTYGHVKVSDDYLTDISDDENSDTVVASQSALHNAYNSLSEKIGTQVMIAEEQPSEKGVVWFLPASRAE